MTKAQQEQAFKGDPNRVPADIRAKYMTGKMVIPPVSPAAAIAADQAKKAEKQ